MISVDTSGFQIVTCSHKWPIMVGETCPYAHASVRVSECLKPKHVSWMSTIIHISSTTGGTMHSDRGKDCAQTNMPVQATAGLAIDAKNCSVGKGSAIPGYHSCNAPRIPKGRPGMPGAQVTQRFPLNGRVD
jgi:hypothetical protein